MFSEEVRKLLAQVITSWQVLVVTGVLIIYVFLVNYVARLHHRRRHTPMPKIKPQAPDAPAPSAAAPAASEPDELGLEE